MATEFDKILKNTLVTLRDRARYECKSEEIAVRLQEAINFIEVGVSLGGALEAVTRKSSKDVFAETFLTPELVHCVRQRDSKRGIAEFRRIANVTKNDVVAAISSMPPDMAEKIMPWSLLDKLFSLGVQIETAVKIPDRVIAFNEKYEEFVANMVCAFPLESTTADEFVAKMKTDLMYEPEYAYLNYKEQAMPFMDVMKGGKDQTHVVFREPEKFFCKIPYIGDLPLQKYWKTQVIENQENYKYIAETFSQLLIGLIGLPIELLGGDMISSVQKYVSEEIKKSGKVPAVKSDGSADMSEVMGIAMSVIGDMQENGTLDNLMAKLDGSKFDVDEELLEKMNAQLDLGPEMQAAIESFTSLSGVNDDHPIFSSTRGHVKDEDN